MTSSKNTNSHNPLPNSENSNANNSLDKNFDNSWSQFVSEHKEDFNDLEKSKSAKIFKKRINQAAKPLKNIALSDKSDLKKSDLRKSGPRDNTKLSWLDVDKTMDEYGDDFIAPNPHFNNVSITLIVLWSVFILGILGMILSVLVPYLALYTGSVSAFLFLIGGAGLLMSRKKSNTSIEDYNEFGRL